jgi:hypothetical protein
MKTWHALLSARTFREQQYGPHTNEIGSMVVALREAPWYTRVGKPSSLDGRVTRVASLSEAWSTLQDRDRYAAEGVLVAPSDHIYEVREAHPAEAQWWKAARSLVIDAVDHAWPPVPPGASGDFEALAMDHATLTLDLIVAEVILSEHTQCTYFREQLQWLAAGYFPCGWDGSWPEGLMRVL